MDLRLRLGSVGQRLGAFAIDVGLLLAAMIAFTLACLLVGFALRQATLFIAWTLGFFALRNGYFLFWELGLRGATPGKRVVGVRVAARDGGRLRADAVFARNAMREVELFLPVTFLSLSFVQGAWGIGLAGLGWSAGLLLLPLFNRDRAARGRPYRGHLGGGGGRADGCSRTWRRAPRRSAPATLSPPPSSTPTARWSCTCWRRWCASASAPS